MKTEDIKKMAQAWQQVQEASKKNEELVGKQHKLDHNKNGKIDAADFKGLRNKSKKNAETETVTSEETVNEISKKTLGSYIKKANMSAMDHARKSGEYNNPDQPKHFSKAMDRMRGVKKATDKLVAKEEAELEEDVFAMDIDYNQEKRLAAAAKAAGIAIKFVQAGGATEMQLRGDKDKITKFLKARRVPASEISRGWFKEEAEWPVYERIKENRAMRYKGATAPETMDDKLKGAGAKKMKSDFAGNTTDPDFEEKGHDDATKAGRITKKSPARTGDQAKGDTKIMNPVKDTTK